MAWRSNEAPMEFEYDNGVGNLDSSESRSPFAKLASQQKASTLDRNFGSSYRPPSPTRQKPARDVPTLPQTPQAAPVFRETINTDFSSSGELSPDGGNGADSEDTPEPKRIENVTLFRGSSPSKSKSPTVKRLSWMQKFKPSRAHTELMRKTHKRKRREVDRDNTSVAMRQGYDDPYRDDSRPSTADGPSSEAAKTQEVGTIAGVLTFVHEHPRLPTILAFWGQCLFSFFILAMLGWMIWSIRSAVLQQVEVEAESLGQDALREIESCRKQWLDNRCDSDRVPPALQDLCADWDHCRNQDWRAKGRAKIGARTFAQILNSFVDELSYKLILLLAACLALLITSSYTLFNPIRRPAEVPFQPPAPTPNYYPQTPSRQMQAEWANATGFATGFFTPQTGRQWESNEWGSPGKRIEGRSKSPAKLEFRKYS